MENISIAKIWCQPLVLTLSLMPTIFGSSDKACGQTTGPESAYQMSVHSPEYPSSPHQVHRLKNQTFSVSIGRSSDAVEEENGASSATFDEDESKVIAAFGRAVNPSVGLGLTLINVRSHSSFSSIDGVLTDDVERDVQSSIGLVDATYKVMDAIVLGLRLGTQLSRLEFNGTDAETISTQHWGPAIAWKSETFELAAYRSNRYLQIKDLDGKRVVRQFSESGLVLSGGDDGVSKWSVWLQKNPLKTCCAFTASDRVVYGGRIFLPVADWNVSPGYRYLSEFSDDSSPGSIEDPARHNIFVDGVTGWHEWLPGLHLSYEMGARKTGPSSLRAESDNRSNYDVQRWAFSGSWGRAW